MNKRGDKTILAIAIACFVAGIVAPFFATTPLSSLICDALVGGSICNPMLGLFVFFGILMFFALMGIGLIFVALRTPSKKVPAQKTKS